MTEAFGFYAENILTKDYFEAVLEAKLDARFAQQDLKFEARFSRLEKRLSINNWILGVLVVVLLLPELKALVDAAVG